jgi:hypothetical protein
MPSDDHHTDHPSQEPAQPSRRPRRAAARKLRPGRMRLFVAMGGRPARWYRSPAEAAADARTLLDTVSPGEVVARAWTDEPAAGPPAWELRRGPRRSIVWTLPSGDQAKGQ